MPPLDRPLRDDPLLDPALLEELLTESRELEAPAVRPGAFDPAEVGELVLRGLRRLCADDSRTRDRAVRLWVASQADGRGEEELFDRPPAAGEDLASWGHGLFPGRSWGLVVNLSERWMPELAAQVAAFMAPLRARVPPPASSFELVLFAGCYERTPFGVHTDPPNLRTVHLQLGPGAKTVRVQRDGVAPARRFAEEQRTLDSATASVLEPGSIMVVPTHHPHLASCHGFAVGVAVIFERVARRKHLAAALRTAASELEILVPWPGDPARLWDSLPADLDYPELVGTDLSVARWVEEAVQEEALRSVSNAGFVEPPWPARGTGASHADLAPSRIRLLPHFPLRALRSEGRLLVFARGHRLSLPEAPGAVAWLRSLPRGRFAEVARSAEAAGLSPDTARELTEILVRCRAVETAAAPQAPDG